MMNKDVKLNLVVIVKDITTDYMLTQYCKFYSKYPNIVKLHAVIKSDDGKHVKRIINTFNSYFDNTDIRLNIYDKYSIEEETIYASDVLNYRMNDDEWFFMADIDEYVELEKINPEWFEKYNIIKGLLIDRIQEENQEFDEEKSLFENYPTKCFLYNALNTSYPLKKTFIKKQDFFIKVGYGHHAIEMNLMDSMKLKFINEYVPVYHFKWNYNFVNLLHQSINNTKNVGNHEQYISEQTDMIKLCEKESLCEFAKNYEITDVDNVFIDKKTDDYHFKKRVILAHL